jgi:hypothetical protein
MSGDVHVWFCERPGVRLPRPTHLVCGFERADEADRFLVELGSRLAKFGLRISPAKMSLDAEARISEEPGAGKLHAGICAGPVRYWRSYRDGSDTRREG